MTIEEYENIKYKSESKLQIECVRWFGLNYPEKIIFAIPNGGSRNIIEAAKMKREGILKGIPDLCIPEASKGFNSLYIEMKFGKNKPSKEQLEIIKKLEYSGNCVKVCYTKKDFTDAVHFYFKKKEENKPENRVLINDYFDDLG